jgi:photosystem II stability/assembly factor-like uncharacterized protein
MRLAYVSAGVATAVLLAVAAAAAAPRAWHEPGTPEGGPVYELALGPDGTFYAGAFTGIFTSRDGTDWQRAGRFPNATEDAGADDIAAPSGPTVYVVMDRMLFKSTNAGRSWRRVDGGDRRDHSIFTAATPQGRADIVYAGSLTSVFRSGDGGKSWARTGYGRTEGGPPQVMVVDPATPSTAYVGTVNGFVGDVASRGIYRTLDAGATWTPVNVGLPLEFTVVTALAIDPGDPRVVYAGTMQYGVYKSVDGGMRWIPASTGLPAVGDTYESVGDLAVDPARPGVVYAATGRGVAWSLDGGLSWSADGSADAPYTWAVCPDERAPGTLLAGTAGHGVLRSTDGGEHWSAANTGLTAVAVMAIAVDPSRPASILVGGFETGLVRTANEGRTWSPVRELRARTVRAIAFGSKPSRIAYASADEMGVLRSVAGGPWTRVGSSPSGQITALAVDPGRSSTVYAADLGLYKTVNGGAAWRKLPAAGLGIRTVAIDPARTATVVAGGDHVAISGDGGKNWRQVEPGFPSEAEVRALAFAAKSGDVYAAVNGSDDYDVYVGDGVYRLTRGGARWTRIAAGLPRLAGGKLAELRSLAANPRTGAVYVGTNRGLYELLRRPGVLRWRLADPIFAGRTVRRLAFSPDGSRLYAATPGRLLVSR